jgi:hypothetical protein
LLALAPLALWAFAPRAALAGDDPKKDAKAYQPEEDDFTGTPYTEYGEFNEEEDEEEDAKFFKFGRLFGISLGLGFQGVDGYKGVIYEGGFPVLDAKIHYWFDFHFAVDLDIAWAQHSYNDDISTTKGGQISVNIIRFGIDGKYYFDTHNLSAPLSFASPYVVVGFGAFSKSESSAKKDTNEVDTAVGFSPGMGLEFALKPRKAFLALEAKYNIVNFPKDSGTDRFVNATPKLENFTGNFFSLLVNFLLTW